MPDRIPTFRPPWINRKPRRDAMRRNQSAAGYGRRAWRLARQEALVRDNWQCQDCKSLVTGREAHVDPVDGTPVENWDTDEPSERGIDGIERIRLVRDDIAHRVDDLAARLRG